MKTRPYLCVCLCGVLFTEICALAQGPLTPPGGPAPTMKALDQVEPRTLISSVPYTISNSGSYYLAANLTGVLANNNGIAISAGNVVLDLNGFALVGASNNTFSGIYVVGSLTNITIRNGSISGWGASGVDAYSFGPAVNLLLERLTCSGNSHYGIGAGHSSIVRECLCQNNGWSGIWVDSDSLVSECMANGNSQNGVYSADNFNVKNCTADRNGGWGFYLGSNGEIRECIANANSAGGIVTSNRCMVRECTAMVNRTGSSPGIFVGGDTVVADCHASANYGAGIETSAAVASVNGMGCRLENNQTRDSLYYGVLASPNGLSPDVILRNSSGSNSTGDFYPTGGSYFAPVQNPSLVTNAWGNIAVP